MVPVSRMAVKWGTPHGENGHEKGRRFPVAWQIPPINNANIERKFRSTPEGVFPSGFKINTLLRCPK
jgi:hypothetical protein